jgi:hypothetical protein
MQIYKNCVQIRLHVCAQPYLRVVRFFQESNRVKIYCLLIYDFTKVQFPQIQNQAAPGEAHTKACYAGFVAVTEKDVAQIKGYVYGDGSSAAISKFADYIGRHLFSGNC